MKFNTNEWLIFRANMIRRMKVEEPRKVWKDREVGLCLTLRTREVKYGWIDRKIAQ